MLEKNAQEEEKGKEIFLKKKMQIIEKENSEKGENVKKKKKGKMNFPHKKTLLIPYFLLPLSPKKK